MNHADRMLLTHIAYTTQSAWNPRSRRPASAWWLLLALSPALLWVPGL